MARKRPGGAALPWRARPCIPLHLRGQEQQGPASGLPEHEGRGLRRVGAAGALEEARGAVPSGIMQAEHEGWRMQRWRGFGPSSATTRTTKTTTSPSASLPSTSPAAAVGETWPVPTLGAHSDISSSMAMSAARPDIRALHLLLLKQLRLLLLGGGILWTHEAGRRAMGDSGIMMEGRRNRDAGMAYACPASANSTIGEPEGMMVGGTAMTSGGTKGDVGTKIMGLKVAGTGIGATRVTGLRAPGTMKGTGTTGGNRLITVAAGSAAAGAGAGAETRTAAGAMRIRTGGEETTEVDAGAGAGTERGKGGERPSRCCSVPGRSSVGINLNARSRRK